MSRSCIARPGIFGLAVAATMLAATGCSRPGGPYSFSNGAGEFGRPDAAATVIPIMMRPQPAPTCVAALSSQPIPPRSTLLDPAAGASSPTSNIELTSDLFTLFKAVCGSCHVESVRGNFSVTSATFSSLVDQTVLDQIKSDNLTISMPPDGIRWSDRAASDSVVQLANQLTEWINQNRPVGSFMLSDQSVATNVGYVMSPALGAQLTNIGSCIPDRRMIGTKLTTMNQLDAMFASATQLPATLDQTDLSSLDSAELAQNGVISFAPAYPLWSDNAQKMRYVRVPVGQSIAFDKKTQEFQIPPNTRFYKTFLKEVVDANGSKRFRKIETRLIVSRPDTVKPDGTAQQNAIFGTYVWNADETQASLLTTPLRNGKPFADRIFTYVTDEQKADAIIATNPANLDSALKKARITRQYALPGSERCIQCHEGSTSKDFILGFRPVQIARRPTGAGGVYEAAADDELTQLQRFIDYGLITGVNSAADILPLEKSEGSRVPRNQQELNAQAYMVGNCAHCHNPRGFPSIRQPAVANVLNFLPGPGDNQGIFQFPLTASSPIRYRGLNQNVKMAYVTPSLYDIASAAGLPKFFCPKQPDGACAGNTDAPQWILAPWRSLIYRNVDTPYDYFDDFAPYPHMPLNTSGYDCRAKQLMGDWMVSIPATQKDPTHSQSVLPDSEGQFPPNANTDPQPYVEVRPDDPGYAEAVGAASARLQQYHASFRYGFCPPEYTADIVDPVIQAEADLGGNVQPDVEPIKDPADPTNLLMPVLTPVRPNYVSFDTTDPPGDWLPRRPDWEKALVNPDIMSFIADTVAEEHLTSDAAEDLQNVIEKLQTVKLADAKSALTEPIPFGLWDTSVPGCDFSSVPKASAFLGPNQPQWMTVAQLTDANKPVLVETPGAAVFNTVCYNCHGTQADSQGLLADEITNLTGGDARVANFRDGLFGPLNDPASNRAAVFGPDAASLGLTADDLGARYLAWMALGGTSKHLPLDVLNQVSLSPVVGVVRSHLAIGGGTPDMLRLGLYLCEQLASSDGVTTYSLSNLVGTGLMGWSENTSLVDRNGDAEMWLKLCNLNNRPIVRVAYPDGDGWKAATKLGELKIDGFHLYWGASPDGYDNDKPKQDWYGQNPVMDDRGNLHQGLTPDN
ncbi:MAG: hypothetical protein ABUS79_17010, partial [Pseudomonadota bacterium]